MASMIVFLLALLAVLAYHLHLQDRGRRDVVDLARRLVESGQPVPPEVLDRLMAGPDKVSTPRWAAPAFFLFLAVAFTLAGIEQDGRGELDERLLMFAVATIFLVISGITYLTSRRPE